jgi:hypothetical protein
VSWLGGLKIDSYAKVSYGTVVNASISGLGSFNLCRGEPNKQSGLRQPNWLLYVCNLFCILNIGELEPYCNCHFAVTLQEEI